MVVMTGAEMELDFSGGIIEVDLHGLYADGAREKIDHILDTASTNVYRIRLVHGYRRGTALRDMIWEEYSYGRAPRVKRIIPGSNMGVTELILKEY